MRVACERCHQVAEASVRLDATGAALAITCSACGQTFDAPLARAADLPAPAGPRCPKCEAPAVTDGPCPKCGLAPEHAARWRERAAEPPTASIGAAWDAAVAAWTDEQAHERAAIVAIATSDYAWLAARYRAVTRERPDDAIAHRQLARLSRRAEATLRATATAPAKERATSARVPYAVLLAIVAVVAGGMLYAMHVIRQRTPDQDTGRVERIAPLPSRR